MEYKTDAVYERGVLTLSRELPLKDGQKVRVVIRPISSAADRFGGSVPWTGDPDELTAYLADPDECQWGNHDV
jgi:predicted DNA-binding antitoxin AbrB/MazE fold protein